MDGTEVAVKVLPPELWRDADSRVSLVREAKLSLKLSHPCIVRLINLEPGDSPFLVMEYVGGVSLGEELAGRREIEAAPMTPAEALPIIEDLAGALDHAHELKIIHRDLKPSNVMLLSRADGGYRAKLADFGIAAELTSFKSRQSRRMNCVVGLQVNVVATAAVGLPWIDDAPSDAPSHFSSIGL